MENLSRICLAVPSPTLARTLAIGSRTEFCLRRSLSLFARGVANFVSSTPSDPQVSIAFAVDPHSVVEYPPDGLNPRPRMGIRSAELTDVAAVASGMYGDASVIYARTDAAMIDRMTSTAIASK